MASRRAGYSGLVNATAYRLSRNGVNVVAQVSIVRTMKEDNPMKSFFILLLVPSLSVAATIRVPLDYASIQDACDAASDGDTVLVAPAEYEITQPTG